MLLFRSASYDYVLDDEGTLVTSLTTREARRRPALVSGRDRARQEFRLECDPNNVVRRYATTGDLGRMNPRTGAYLDVSEVPDLLGAAEQMASALDAFQALPQELRNIVHDDPRKLLQLAEHQAAVKAYKAAHPDPVPTPNPAPAPAPAPASAAASA